MDREERMQAALAEIKQSSTLNYTELALKHNIHRTTLSRRHRGLTRSHHDFQSESKQLLTTTQEDLLVKEIYTLGLQGLHPTTKIIQNIVEEQVGHKISRGWAPRFVHRHKHKLKNVYLHGFDKNRFKSECVSNIQVFYQRVSDFI
jgi:transposase